MRILITGTTYRPNFDGQAIFTTNLAEGLAKRGHEVMALIAGEKSDCKTINGVKVRIVKSVSFTFIHDNVYIPFNPIREVRQVLDEFKPQAVHVHDHYPLSRSVVRAAKERQLRIMGTNHFMPENWLPYFPKILSRQAFLTKFLWGLMTRFFNSLDVATAPSRTAAGILQAQGVQVPVYAISCGVDPKRFFPDPDLDRTVLRQKYGLDPHKKLFAFVGRVDGEKRIDVLLRAIHRLNRDDIQLVVVGRGSAFDSLKNLTQDLHLNESRVRFTGFVPNEDLPRLLNSADVFCMPSEAELLSIVSLEAMACGKPILAANSKALPELVNHNVNGYLFNPGNVEDIVQYMTILADHPERWEAMGRASLDKVRPHWLENTLSSYEAIYEKMFARESLVNLIPQGLKTQSAGNNAA